MDPVSLQTFYIFGKNISAIETKNGREYDIVCKTIPIRMHQWQRRWGLEINREKIQYLCTGEETTDLRMGNNEMITTCKPKNAFW